MNNKNEDKKESNGHRVSVMDIGLPKGTRLERKETNTTIKIKRVKKWRME